MKLKQDLNTNSFRMIFGNMRRCFSDEEQWYQQGTLEGSNRGMLRKTVRLGNKSCCAYLKNVGYISASECINLYFHTWIIILRNV